MSLLEAKPGDRRGYRDGCGSWDRMTRNLRYGKSLAAWPIT